MAWIPQVFYDLIGRVVPGGTVWLAAYFLFSDPNRIVDGPFLEARSSSVVTGFVWVILSYVIGLLLGAVGFFVMEKEWTVTPSSLSVDDPPNLENESIRRSFMYDGIQIFHPETGARLAKLSAEQHLCRVFIVGFTLLLIVRIGVGIFTPLGLSPVVLRRLALVCLAAIASWFFYRHLKIRTSRLMANVWHSLDLASKSREVRRSSKIKT